MKEVKQYVLVSPREPSGVAWLLNLFLELGIMVYRQSPDYTWHKQSNGTYCLQPAEQDLKRWLPCLSKNESHFFRTDLNVEWKHDWPSIKSIKDKTIILFWRDPKAALYSGYHRENCSISFRDYYKSIDPELLLNRLDYWNLFILSWLTVEPGRIISFEEVKKASFDTVSELCEWLNLTYSDEEINLAIENSSFEHARMAEIQYRKENEIKGYLVNRSGKVDEWKNALNEVSINEIDMECKQAIHWLQKKDFVDVKNYIVKRYGFHLKLFSNHQSKQYLKYTTENNIFSNKVVEAFFSNPYLFLNGVKSEEQALLLRNMRCYVKNYLRDNVKIINNLRKEYRINSLSKSFWMSRLRFYMQKYKKILLLLVRT